MKFGNILDIALTKNNLSVSEVAAQLFVSKKTIYRWLKNENEPDFETICKLCVLLKIDLTEILAIVDSVPIISIAQDADEDHLLATFRSLTKEQKKFFIKNNKLIVEILNHFDGE